MIDITNFITWFINSFFDILSYCIGVLDNITFFGFSFFQYILALVILPVGLAITIPIVKPKQKERNSKGGK